MRLAVTGKQRNILRELRNIRKEIRKLRGDLVRKRKPLWHGNDCNTFCQVTNKPIPKEHAIAYAGKEFVHPGVKRYVQATGDWFFDREIPAKFLRTPTVVFFWTQGPAKGSVHPTLFLSSDYGQCVCTGDTTVHDIAAAVSPSNIPVAGTGFILHD